MICCLLPRHISVWTPAPSSDASSRMGRLLDWRNTGSLTFSERTCVAAALVFLIALRRHSVEGRSCGRTGLGGGPIVHGCSGCSACRVQMGHSSFHPHSAPRRLFIFWTRSPPCFSLGVGYVWLTSKRPVPFPAGLEVLLLLWFVLLAHF